MSNSTFENKLCSPFQILSRVFTIRSATYNLINQHGLLPWLHSIITQPNHDDVTFGIKEAINTMRGTITTANRDDDVINEPTPDSGYFCVRICADGFLDAKSRFLIVFFYYCCAAERFFPQLQK